MILNGLGVMGHGEKTYCKAYKICNEIIDESAEYTRFYKQIIFSLRLNFLILMLEIRLRFS